MTQRPASVLRAALVLIGLVLPGRSDGTPTVLRRAAPRVSSLDPVQAASEAACLRVGLLYETLLAYEPADRPYRLRPNLSEKLPDIAADGRTLRLRLRPDARFVPDPCFGRDAAGRPISRTVTAEDVVYSLKRLADPRQSSPGAWTVVGRIEGMSRFRDQAAAAGHTDYDRAVDGLRVLGDLELEIRLVAPAPFWTYVLAMPYTAVVPREAVEHYGEGFAAHPVGSGPYRLGSWRRHHRMRLVRNAAWSGWRQATGAVSTGKVPFEHIDFLVMDDPATQWMAFLAGELDLQGDVGRDYWDGVVDADGRLRSRYAQRGIRMQTLEALDVAYLGFNFDDPVVGANRALRQAIQAAFDAATWEQFHQHRVRRANGPVPPGVAGRLETPMPNAFNLDRARRLMVAAGYPGGIDPETGDRLELQLDVGRTDTEMRESIELLSAFLVRIGIRLRPNYSHWPAFLARVSRREAQMFRLKWIADYPDAENFLQLFFSPNASPGPNRANFQHPEYDRLYREAVAEVDPERRLTLYRSMQSLLLEEQPWVFLHHRIKAALAHSHVEGFRPHAFPYGMEVHYRTEAGLR